MVKFDPVRPPEASEETSESSSSELSEIVELPNIEEQSFDSAESRPEFIWIDSVDSWVFPGTDTGWDGADRSYIFSEQFAQETCEIISLWD